MPLFMDRHDLPGVSAEDIAAAHAKDVEVQEAHGVKFLSYWFDEENEAAFCLARAPTSEGMEAVHRASHGFIPNQIIPVAEDAVLRFLGTVHEPADETELTSAFRTILFTDLEGSTELANRLEPQEFLGLVSEHDVIVRRALLASRGREVKHTGDGIMAAFGDASNALDCALAIRDGFTSRNESAPTLLSVRIGLAAGEPVDRDGDLFGSTVNLASRLCTAAEPNTILVSELVSRLGSARGFAFTEADERVLKGFAEPVRAFELHGTGK